MYSCDDGQNFTSFGKRESFYCSKSIDSGMKVRSGDSIFSPELSFLLTTKPSLSTSPPEKVFDIHIANLRCEIKFRAKKKDVCRSIYYNAAIAYFSDL
jgi:hypothetical protein